MGNDNAHNSEIFHGLMKQLEFLMLKFNHNIYYQKNDKYYQLYNKMPVDALIKNIQTSLKNCETELNKILNSSKYTPGILFEAKELDAFISKIITWKSKCPNIYQYYFNKTKQLFDKIQNKDLEITETQMEIETVGNTDKRNNEVQIKTQKYINKQEVIQAQELALLNDNFGRALASLECFANRFSGKNLSNMFGYYDMFNYGNTQDLIELQKKAFVQTQIFNLAYEDYVKKYEKYDVPENISILEIKNVLNNWIQFVPDEHKIMYRGMLNTINSLNNDEFGNQFKLYTEQYKNATLNPKKISCFAPAVFYYNQQRCEEAENDYLNEGKLSSKININQNYKNDEKAEQLQQQILINENLYSEMEEFNDIK